MKLISSTMDHVTLQKGKINFIYCADHSKEYLLRQEISNWLNPKKELNHLFFILDNHKELNYKNCNAIELHGGLVDDVSNKILVPWIKYQLLNTSVYCEKIQEIHSILDQFFLGLTLRINEVEVDVFLEEFPIESILKSATIEIINKNKFSKGYVSNRETTIKIWTQMIFNENPKLVFYYFPESDGINTETLKFLRELEQLNITTICITRSVELMKHYDFNQINLIKNNGSIYPVSDLYLQLVSFDLFQGEALTIEVALKDFHEDYQLLNDTLKKFLLSAKFNL